MHPISPCRPMARHVARPVQFEQWHQPNSVGEPSASRSSLAPGTPCSLSVACSASVNSTVAKLDGGQAMGRAAGPPLALTYSPGDYSRTVSAGLQCGQGETQRGGVAVQSEGGREGAQPSLREYAESSHHSAQRHYISASAGGALLATWRVAGARTRMRATVPSESPVHFMCSVWSSAISQNGRPGSLQDGVGARLQDTRCTSLPADTMFPRLSPRYDNGSRVGGR